MANLLMVAGKIAHILGIIILVALLKDTYKCFDSLPESHKGRPVLALNVLVLFIVLVILTVKLLIN